MAMGYGAFIHITNGTDKPVQVTTVSEHCMHGTGHWGDILFPKDEYPSQYIEAKASGSCITQTSLVKYEFRQILDSSAEVIATLELVEKGHNWSVGDSTHNVQVDEITQEKQAHMWFTVVAK
ncbi:hypothetical protein [Pseudoalteromonas viridis]|uniref:Uncharacterized protein n=1 Tax=Pseudoalteromonas viridis TaxID=339617 RepID=A0ABX7VC62_9GAMM|nr:hypothetical protein [Pseudoalteromonas viridis]QTL37382.1 hypothetical protein J5X90_21280 [Pseudoalteromonas viridis]